METSSVVAGDADEAALVSGDRADVMMTDDEALKAVVFTTAKNPAPAGLRAVINIGEINSNFMAGDTVTLEALKAKKLVPAKSTRLKVLSVGGINKPLTIEADAFSLQAIKMITLTGGTAIQKK